MFVLLRVDDGTEMLNSGLSNGDPPPPSVSSAVFQMVDLRPFRPALFIPAESDPGSFSHLVQFVWPAILLL